MTSTVTQPMHEELASRESNGIRVSLIWSRSDDNLMVTVHDASTDSAFEIAVGQASPLDVFNHPFAHAAFRGIPYAAAMPEPSAEPVLA
jgi:hypothetical protein